MMMPSFLLIFPFKKKLLHQQEEEQTAGAAASSSLLQEPLLPVGVTTTTVSAAQKQQQQQEKKVEEVWMICSAVLKSSNDDEYEYDDDYMPPVSCCCFSPRTTTPPPRPSSSSLFSRHGCCNWCNCSCLFLNILLAITLPVLLWLQFFLAYANPNNKPNIDTTETNDYLLPSWNTLQFNILLFVLSGFLFRQSIIISVEDDDDDDNNENHNGTTINNNFLLSLVPEIVIDFLLLLLLLANVHLAVTIMYIFTVAFLIFSAWQTHCYYCSVAVQINIEHHNNNTDDDDEEDNIDKDQIMIDESLDDKTTRHNVSGGKREGFITAVVVGV